MNKLPARILTSVLFALLLLAFPSVRAQATPSITIEPVTITAAQNTTFTVTVKINTDSTNVRAADATLHYGGSDLEFVSATKGSFLPEFTSANDPVGTLELHAYTLSALEDHSGAGTVATVVFKAKKGTGSSTLTFTCSGNGQDTGIRSAVDNSNILNCSNTNAAGISFTGTTVTATSTLTPTATTAPGTTATPTPTTGDGNIVPTCQSLYSDISSAVGTPLTVTLTCSGVDPSGYINAAEFTFGDNTKQTVEKNAGSPGSIATTHTYTTIGSVGPSCRVRDNNGVWSSVPDNCKKIITIKAKPAATATPTPTSRSYLTGPTPTPIVVNIVSDTPSPTPGSGNDDPDPTLYPGEPDSDGTSDTGSDRIWWIIGGLIAVLLAFLLLRRREPNMPYRPPVAPPTAPPPTTMQ